MFDAKKKQKERRLIKLDVYEDLKILARPTQLENEAAEPRKSQSWQRLSKDTQRGIFTHTYNLKKVDPLASHWNSGKSCFNFAYKVFRLSQQQDTFYDNRADYETVYF